MHSRDPGKTFTLVKHSVLFVNMAASLSFLMWRYVLLVWFCAAVGGCSQSYRPPVPVNRLIDVNGLRGILSKLDQNLLHTTASLIKLRTTGYSGRKSRCTLLRRTFAEWWLKAFGMLLLYRFLGHTKSLCEQLPRDSSQAQQFIYS